MRELLTAAQMRAIEEAAIAAGEVTGLALMERAGRGVVAAVFENWPELAPSWGPAPKPQEYLLQDDEVERHRAVVLCGPGNNGGDGFVVARLLKEAGWDVKVFLYGDAGRFPPDARVNFERWIKMGPVAPFDQAPRNHNEADLYVDALFGTGLIRPLAGGLREWVAGQAADPGVAAKTVAVDLPSGLCSDSGRELGGSAGAVRAGLTVSFHRLKLGHVLDWGPHHSGKTAVADIGLSEQLQAGSVQCITGPTRRLGRAARAHKYAHGHALILSGGVGKGGAARLAARGALRIGAGAVTIGCPPAALIENAAQLNAIMLCAVKGVDGVDKLLGDDRINALCLGPGMGLSDESRGLVEAGLKSGRPMVLDADALTLIGGDASLFALLHERCVLTPHGGEFARLFPDITAKLAAPASTGPAYSKVDATREAAKRAGCVVLFKGPDTVIADLSGRCSVNASFYERSAPWLATAGSGDVLAGFITGLLARGFAPVQAAETGAWLHTECAISFGPGLIAEDLTEELPKVFRSLDI